MSRVYDALKKVESQRTDELRRREMPRPEPPPEPRAQRPEPAAPKPIPARPLAAPKPGRPRPGRGPFLLPENLVEYSKAAEQFHLMAANLQSWAIHNEKRVFMITSALSGEGKSFIAMNLATSLSRIGARVLLVDADLRSSSLHRVFGLSSENGLVGYLKNEIEFGATLHPTTYPGLLLVPAGGTIYAPTEALAGPRMRDFMHEARSMVPPHIVIIDAPAAAAVPESQILNRLIDALVIVVAADRTPREMVQRTIAAAEGTAVFGLALNRFDPPRSAISHYPDKYSRPAASRRDDLN